MIFCKYFSDIDINLYKNNDRVIEYFHINFMGNSSKKPGDY